jgi:NAD(P)-dependent dehydrogenase (short-subunit alcohol dehydrogenase family)
MSMKKPKRPVKVAVVTGGAQGIGKAITLKLANEHWKVVAVDIDKEAGQELLGYSKIYTIVFKHLDVSDEDSVEQFFNFVEKEYGRLDALINNAGLASPDNAPIEELKFNEWQEKITVNLFGPMFCTKHGANLLRKSKGAVVNIASTRALMSEPDNEAYSASKGGVVALTHALANSLGPDVRVNAISPGWIDVQNWQKRSERNAQPLREIDHKQHLVGRVGRPSDIADMACYLVSTRAGFITGQNFVIDGGMNRKMIYQ